MPAVVVKTPSRSKCPEELRRMVRMIVWATGFVALGLGHIELRLATRDMNIEKARLQAQEVELLSREGSLKSDIGRMGGGDGTPEGRRQAAGLIALAPEQIQMWTVPQELVDKYDRVLTDKALARSGGVGLLERETILDRIAVALFPPVHADQPAD